MKAQTKIKKLTVSRQLLLFVWNAGLRDSIPFLLEFSVSVIPVISIVIALLEFLISFVSIFAV